jgi:hypothetical protein
MLLVKQDIFSIKGNVFRVLKGAFGMEIIVSKKSK